MFNWIEYERSDAIPNSCVLFLLGAKADEKNDQYVIKVVGISLNNICGDSCIRKLI